MQMYFVDKFFILNEKAVEQFLIDFLSAQKCSLYF
jgi:hypothetical protein